MFRPVMRKIADALLKVATEEQEDDYVERPVTSISAMQPAQFNLRVKQLFAARSDFNAPIAGSTVQLIGMRHIQADLSDIWPLVAAKAYDVTEKVIQRNLSTDDFYMRQDEENYVLCFPLLSKRTAEKRTQAIVDEIEIELVREVPEAAHLRIGHQVGEVTSSDVLKEGGSFFSAIAASLDVVRREAQETYERYRRMLLKDATVIFSPVWNPQRQRVMLYRCLLDDLTSRSTLKALETIADPSALQQAVADLDYLFLGRAIEVLHASLPGNGKIILMLPVNFATLSHKNFRDAYLDLMQRVPQPYRKYLFIEIYGVPSETPTSRILQVTLPVKPYCSALIISASPATAHTFFDLKGSGIFGVSITFDELQEANARVLEKYVIAAKSAELRTFMHGAKTTGQLKAIVDIGINYIDGDAVAPRVDAPRGAYHWKLSE